MWRAVVVASLLAGCASESEPPMTDGGHRISIEAELVAHDGDAAFLTPNATVGSIRASDLAGKPFVISLFEGGFSQGNDEPFELIWGEVPSDRRISFTSQRRYPAGPYDASVIIYVNTPVSDADRIDDGHFRPSPPIGGDLSAFTLDQRDVLDGDPPFDAGVVRVNVVDGDAVKRLSNRTPVDPDDSNAIIEAFHDTILMVP
jgi:hypothetical protein